jgi:hypothetical protein
MHPKQSPDSATTVRVSESTHRKLKDIKPSAITFDAFIRSLLDEIESANHDVAFERANS